MVEISASPSAPSSSGVPWMCFETISTSMPTALPVRPTGGSRLAYMPIGRE